MSTDRLVVIEQEALLDQKEMRASGMRLLKGYGKASSRRAAADQLGELSIGLSLRDELLMIASMAMLSYNPESSGANLEIVKTKLLEEWNPILAPGAIGLLDTVVRSNTSLVFLESGSGLEKKITGLLNQHGHRLDESEIYPNIEEVIVEWAPYKKIVLVSSNPLLVAKSKLKKHLGFLVTSNDDKKVVAPSGDINDAHSWLLKTISRKKRVK